MKLLMRKTGKSAFYLFITSVLLMLPVLSGWHPANSQTSSTENSADEPDLQGRYKNA